MLDVSPSRSLTPGNTMMLLAPAGAAVPGNFQAVNVNAHHHTGLLQQLQRLRGGVYLRDGAITHDDLTRDGRHVQEADDLSWHVVSLQEDGSVAACARLQAHVPDCSPAGLGVWSSALARSAAWSDRLWKALDADLALARLRNVHYIEFGGWAVGDEWRGTSMALTTAMATYALGECVGGFVGVTTATVRHCSSRMMRKLGGHSFTAEGGASVPSYFDDRYGCEMELLRFDSKRPTQRYGARVEDVVRSLLRMPVVCSDSAGAVFDAAMGRQRRLRSLVGRAERHVPCLGLAGLAPA